MYLGRIVAVGMNSKRESAAIYRVSSRSFPNREAKIFGDSTVSIMPRAGFEDDLKKNPYISYNCVRIANNYAVATNGSHTDPISEKIISGMSVRDAMALSLLALDYEKDSYCTPRIAAIVNNNTGWLGIIRKDAVNVLEMKLEPGKIFYIATYEHNTPDYGYFDKSFDADSAASACEYILGKGVFANFTHPVTAAAAFSSEGKFTLAVKTV